MQKKFTLKSYTAEGSDDMARTTITSRVEDEIKIDLQLLADKKGISLSKLNERVLRMYIKQQKKKGVI